MFVYHHSISGIIYPVRPQKHIKSMFMYSNILGAVLLGTEALFAYFVFSGLTNFCVKPDDVPEDQFE